MSILACGYFARGEIQNWYHCWSIYVALARYKIYKCSRANLEPFDARKLKHSKQKSQSRPMN